MSKIRSIEKTVKTILSVQLFCASTLILASLPARAQYHAGPVATAMGGAGRAASDPAESSFLNPASLRHLKQYYVGAIYEQGESPTVGRDKQYGIILADGSPDKVLPGAFSYLRRHIDTPVGAKILEQDYRISLADFVTDAVSMGFGGHYLMHEIDRGPRYFQANLDVGLLYTPLKYFGVGLVGHDLLAVDGKVPLGFQTVPTLGLGFHFIAMELIRTRFDVVRPLKHNRYNRTNVGAGVETLFADFLAFRFGVNFKETENKTLLAAGLGYLGPRLAMSYTFEKDRRVAKATRHFVDLSLPF